jgi:uncharacterized RDD family membrane protein YckC
MFCTKCGKELTDGAQFCPACGTAVGGAPAINVAPVSATVRPPDPKRYRYGGFWIRFLAHIIDQIVLGVVMFVFVLIGILFSAGSIMSLIEMAETEDPDPAVIFGMLGSGSFWESSPPSRSGSTMRLWRVPRRAARFGKMALGLQIIDKNGGTISFARATGRYFAKILASGMIFMIGYIMAGFTAKKQALHDIICDTYVVKQRDTFDYE